MARTETKDIRFTIIDRDRMLRDQALALATLRIYGTNASDVIRTLVARAYVEHFGTKPTAEILNEE